jgi:hypothetical protein
LLFVRNSVPVGDFISEFQRPVAANRPPADMARRHTVVDDQQSSQVAPPSGSDANPAAGTRRAADITVPQPTAFTEAVDVNNFSEISNRTTFC